MISPSFGIQCQKWASSWRHFKHISPSPKYTKIPSGRSSHNRHYSIANTKKSDPLRILFCGSDEFSCASLSALHKEHRVNPDLIKSIDVLVRPGKPTGRGMKVIRQPPLHGLATSLGLNIHDRDTFTGWNMPPDINLIIAVSFGLFVPPRLLSAAKYGGLNVHPSLLPDLRGPAPLQHTLLQNRQFTGVTLQTLDKKIFDHGLILSQTPADSMPVPENCSFQQLHDMVTPAGAELLIRGLRDGVHTPPLQDKSMSFPTQNLQHAPKIRKEQRQITTSNIDNIFRAHRAIGPLWFYAVDPSSKKPTPAQKRVIIQDLDGDISAAISSTSSPLSSSSSTPTKEQTPSKHQYTTSSLHLADSKGERFNIKVLIRKDRARELPSPSPSATSSTHHHAGETKNATGQDDDLNYIYLPAQKCRLKQVTVEGGKAGLPARIALGRMLE